MTIISGRRLPVKQCVFSLEDTAYTLLEYWYETYFKKFQVAYEYGKQTETERYQLITDLYNSLQKNAARTRKVLHEFLFNSAFDWVNNKSLNWVCKSSNLVFILPNVDGTSKAKRPNWTDKRGVAQVVTAL